MASVVKYILPFFLPCSQESQPREGHPRRSRIPLGVERRPDGDWQAFGRYSQVCRRFAQAGNFAQGADFEEKVNVKGTRVLEIRCTYLIRSWISKSTEEPFERIIQIKRFESEVNGQSTSKS